MPSCVDVPAVHTPTATFFRVLGTIRERNGLFYPTCNLKVYSVFLHCPIVNLHCIPQPLLPIISTANCTVLYHKPSCVSRSYSEPSIIEMLLAVIEVFTLQNWSRIKSSL